MTVDDVRRLALSLPEATEQGHHGIPSFRVRKRIFATLPDDAHAHVMIEPEAAAFVASTTPDSVEELLWGKQVAGVRVTLGDVDPGLLAQLLDDAWRRVAPKRLLTGRDNRPPARD